MMNNNTRQNTEEFSPWPSRDILEEELRQKLLSICVGQKGYVNRRLRIRNFHKFPLMIHAPPRLVRSGHFLTSPDQVAHSLSFPDPSFPEDSPGKSGIQNDKTQNKTEAELTAPQTPPGDYLRHIVLLPELNISERYILTHLFLPDEQILALYLYPTRLNRRRELSLPERFEGRAARFEKPGLMEAVVRSIASSPALRSIPESHTGQETGRKKRIQKFLLPREEIEDQEITRMEIISREYNLSPAYELL